MSFLAKMKSKSLCGHKGITGCAIDMVERYGAVAGFGYLHGKYADKAAFRGVPYDVLAGVVLKGTAIGMDVMGRGSKLTPHLNAIGDAGISSFFHTVGVGFGDHTARKSAPVAKAPAALPKKNEAVGMNPAPVGDYLNARELASMVRK